MFAKRRLLIAYALTTIFYHLPAYSSLEYKGSSGSINAGYAGWSSNSINAHRGEIRKVIAGFGMDFEEAEFYSSYESNALNHTVAGRNHTVSVVAHARFFDSSMIFFGKIYGRWDNSWDGDLDMFYGLGYLSWNGSWGFSKPYIGLYNQSGDYISAKCGQIDGWNGYVVGRIAVLPFTLFDEKFALSNWNEIELNRNDAYAEQQSGQNGLNGGLTVTWEFYLHWKVSVT